MTSKRDTQIIGQTIAINSGWRSNTLAARGLEESWNSEELLTESVGPVHFS
jgi:hypothetical protein